MKVTVKTIKQEALPFEVPDDETVNGLKERILAKYQHPVDWQTIIFAGKVLQDLNAKLKDSGIKEGDFLVLMVRKPKSAAPEPQKAAPAPSPVQSSPSPAVAAQAPGFASPDVQRQAQDPIKVADQGSLLENAASKFLVGEELASMLQQILDMGLGFSKEQVLRALRASFNNPDKAVEYLMNGIPEAMDDSPSSPSSPPQQQQAPAVAPAPAAQQPAAAGAAPGAAGAGAIPNLGSLFPGAGAGALDFLRNHPEFNILRARVQQNPQLLASVLQHLAATNPQLLALINQHQQEFMRLLNEPADMGEGGMPPGVPPGAHVIQVTPEEKAAIDRLQALGFDRSIVLEAYFACEKNEELAANYLLEHGFGDED